MDIIINVAVFLISAVIFTMVGVTIRKKIAESKMKSAEQEAKRIIDAAVRDAENKKKEEIFKAKEEIMKAREELDQEVKERRGEVLLQERRIVQKEENLENRTNNLEKKEKDLEFKNQKLDEKTKEIELTLEKQMQELQRISGLSKDDAKKQLLSELEKDLTLEKANLIKEYENKVKENSEKTAKELIGYAIQKCAADHTSETTVSIVELPNDDMKGRIIGREGRNIKALETLTGIDLIIDDTPEAVVISGFDPLRREVAKIALEKLINDGRIHPAKIEEMVEKAKEEIEATIKEEGERAVLETGVVGLHPDIVKLIGKLKYRTSYGQNVLNHSIEVSNLARIMAEELGLDPKLARRAGLLHDIGKALDHDMEGTHVEIGVDILKKYKIVTKWAGAQHVPAYVEVYGYGSHSEPYGVGHHGGTGAAGAAGADRAGSGDRARNLRRRTPVPHLLPLGRRRGHRAGCAAADLAGILRGKPDLALCVLRIRGRTDRRTAPRRAYLPADDGRYQRPARRPAGDGGGRRELKMVRR